MRPLFRLVLPESNAPNFPMKVGILTYHASHNYGAMLQAYALQLQLTRMGHEVRFIHYYPSSVEQANKRTRPIKGVKGMLVRAAFYLVRGMLNRRFDRFEKFKDQYLELTNRYESAEELKEMPPDVDAYVVGSDQVWNVQRGVSKVFFLQFESRPVRKIAYAPSFGTATVDESRKREITPWLERFHHLSAREDSGVQILKDLTGRDSPQVLDPVFLLNCDDWDQVSAKPELNEPYIAFYSLEVSRDVSALVAHVARLLGCRVVVLGKPGAVILTGRAHIAIDSGPAEFLGWLRGATFVISNSFHATAFAIKFGIPFLTLAHSSRNARMESLLALTGLEKRLVHSASDVKSRNISELVEMDFTDPLMKINLHRNVSASFLEAGLKDVPT